MTKQGHPSTRTVLITGTSSGLGEAAVQLFLAQGWQVVATARTSTTAFGSDAVPNLLRARLDITDVASIESAFDLAAARFGHIDVVVNNAGIGMGGALEAMSLEELRKHFEVNVIGTAAVCRAAIHRMRPRRAGLIINVTSVAGRVGLPFLAPYCAGKFAIEGLSEALYYELRLLGIKLKVVEPGGIRSKFSHPWSALDAYEPFASAVLESMQKGIERATPPEVVAKTILSAANDASDRLRYVASDGGVLLSKNRLLPTSAWRAFVAKAFGIKYPGSTARSR
jgi:NAD(P)-dependent dehydrogenase (short-subunit alcohol dehydrogenase family)